MKKLKEQIFEHQILNLPDSLSCTLDASMNVALTLLLVVLNHSTVRVAGCLFPKYS